MDQLIATELRQVEGHLISALMSDDADALHRSWESVARRLSSAMSEGWLSPDTLLLAKRVTAKVVAVATGIAATGRECDGIRFAAGEQCRARLAAFRPATTSTPLRRRVSVPPSSPSLTPTKRAPKDGPTSTSLALGELHGYRPLREWFLAHLAHPWPSAPEKQALLSASPGTTLTFKKVGDWFTNTRRRSGWNAFQKRWARNDKEAIERLVRDLEQPLWAGVHVDPEARKEYARIQAYFGERERVDEDVRVVVDGMASMPGASVGSGDAVVPAESFFDATPRRPSTYPVGLGGRVVSGSSDESTQRSVSASSSLLSYESASPDIDCTPSPLEHPASSLGSSYFPPSTYPPSPPGDIPVLPPTYPLAESPLTFPHSPSPPPPEEPSYEPSPFFSTLSEHPYALFQTDFWALDLGGAAGAEYGYGPVSPRRASE